MRIALVLFDPQSVARAGVDLDQLLAQASARGHHCQVVSSATAVEEAEGVNWQRIPLKGVGRHQRHAGFVRAVQGVLAGNPADCVLGFEPMPGLDALLVSSLPQADVAPRGWAGRFGGGRRYFSDAEAAVFSAASPPSLLFLSALQQARYQAHYPLNSVQQIVLPPGAPQELPAEQSRSLRRAARQRWELGEGELVLLFAGEDFERQGLARAIRALARAREEQPHQPMRLLVSAGGRYRQYHHLARKLGVADAVRFLQGKEDSAELMLGADALVHPAAAEASGPALLQALVAGLPVITTEESGYAAHIAAARAGLVLRQPFQQADLDHAVLRCIDGIYRSQCRETGLAYARLTDLYSLPGACVTHVEQCCGAGPGLGAP